MNRLKSWVLGSLDHLQLGSWPLNRFTVDPLQRWEHLYEVLFICLLSVGLDVEVESVVIHYYACQLLVVPENPKKGVKFFYFVE